MKRDPSRGQDFTQECLDTLQQSIKQHVQLSEMRELFCKKCKQPACRYAGWADSMWSWRMANQPDYLLKDPNWADLSDPRMAAIFDDHKNDLPDNTAKELRLIAAAVKGDWAPLEEEPPSSDGRDEVIADTNAHDEAIRKLAEARGRKVRLPTLSSNHEDPTRRSVPREQMLREIAERLAGGSPVEEAQSPKDQAVVEQVQKMISVEDARKAMEERMATPTGQQPPVSPSAEKPSNPSGEGEPPPPPFPMGNTQVPSDGIMIGGGKPPPPQQQQFPTTQGDSWTPRQKERVVKPGASIRMGATKKDNKK